MSEDRITNNWFKYFTNALKRKGHSVESSSTGSMPKGKRRYTTALPISPEYKREASAYCNETKIWFSEIYEQLGNYVEISRHIGICKSETFVEGITLARDSAKECIDSLIETFENS